VIAYVSTPADLALHGVRIFGFPTTDRVAGRYRLEIRTVEELLLDFEARGWVRHTSFADTSGWSMTDAGRGENKRRLAVELDRSGARDTVVAAHKAFLPLNDRLGAACTDWQIRPTRIDSMAFNDHTDWRWDEGVLHALACLDGEFRLVCDRLSGCLERFARYADLFSAALRKAEAGQRAWVDASDRDSCHLVWMQFHEDLLATLGIPRGADGP
jgi:hypothetical protein